MNDRIEHIDIAKGISIMLVAMYHSQLGAFFPEILKPMSLFRVPLFFFLSGVFFSYVISPKEFLIKKSEALLKPFFSVLILVLFIQVFTQQENILLGLRGILYGNGETLKLTPMWFLTHLFALYCFSYILFRFTIFNVVPSSIQSLFLLIFLFAGVLNIDMFWYRETILFDSELKLPGLPFSVDIIFITSTFFISGHLLKDRVINFSPNVLFFMLSIFVFLYIILFSDAHINLNARIYASPIVATLGAICGIYIVMCISYLLVRYKVTRVVFLNLGGASLYILIFHGIINWKIYNYTSAGVKDGVNLIVLATIAFILSIFLPLIIKWIVLRNDYLALFFLPFKSNKLLQRIFYRRRQNKAL